jgi:long-chain fatty acid transport protein
MKNITAALIAIIGSVHVSEVLARPYPAQTGLAAAADGAFVAGSNPAALTRFDSRNLRLEVITAYSENTWEGNLGNGASFESDDDSTIVIPSSSLVLPLNEKWYFGFTLVGMGFSEDYGDDWPGRYFIEEYSLISISAFPSIAYKVSDQWSVAVSAAISYTSFEQERAVLNVDPGYEDGALEIDADGFSGAFSLSALYEHTAMTRFGFVYRSENESELDGDADFKGLSPTTESILDSAGLLGASIDVDSRSPQSFNAGLYHEFDNGGAVTFDAVWLDFSRFKLSEIYVNGDQILESQIDYDDIYAFSAGYTKPLNARWTFGVGALYVDEMVDDENRSLTLRLDKTWAVGVGTEWQWKPDRSLFAMLTYIQPGDAPVTSTVLPIVGATTGEFSERRIFLLEIGMNIGSGPR